MRIGVSSSGRWWISMGPLGWLLAIWIIAPLWLAWYLLVLLAWLCVLACRGAGFIWSALSRRSAPG